MRELDTDYLVVGAGATGMAFVDALIREDETADVILVDRRHRPGGHWNDAYPFVRLHQPSAYYGVPGRALGHDRIDETGPNAGFYERATAAEICDYYGRVLDLDLLPSGRVRFLGMTDYRGGDADGHRLESSVSGETTHVRVRRKLVDATYMESRVPSRHTPSFEVDEGVRLLPPNGLVDLGAPATRYTVVGAGKTSMDTCVWLMEQGVDPERIRWIRPRDAWTINRAFMQPLEQLGSFMEMAACQVEAWAEAKSGEDFLHRLEDQGVSARIDPDVEPVIFRNAILADQELLALRQIENVVRQGKVRRLGTTTATLDEGSIPVQPGELFVDCTAAGLDIPPARPIFEPDRITLQMVTQGVTPWSGATLGYLEAARDDAARARLCPEPPPGTPLPFEVDSPTLPLVASIGFQAQAARMADPAFALWNDACRLNPARGAMARSDDPRVQAALARLLTSLQPAMANLERLVADPVPGAR